MVESILNTIKAMLGIPSTDTAFDTDIIVLINSALTNLLQIGVSSDASFVVEDDSTKWADLTDNEAVLNMAKTYIFLKVRLTFDPPGTSYLINAYEKQIAEIEWRLNELADSIIYP